MERDLRLIQEKRAERDRANGLISDLSASKETNEELQEEPMAPAENMVIDDPVKESQPPEHPAQPSTQPEDLTEPAAPKAEEVDPEPSRKVDPETIASGQGMPQDSENSVGLAITMPPDDAVEAKEPSGILEAKAVEAAAVPETSLDIPDATDLDFESMFNDTDLTSGDNALNFDLGFSTDPATTQDILNDTSFENLDMSNTDMTILPATTNEDIDSLLPGVENYLNADPDFTNISVPPASIVPEISQTTLTATTTAPAEQAVDAPAADTSFDDNFFGLGGDFSVGETGADDLGDATFGDFEDFDWS